MNFRQSINSKKWFSLWLDMNFKLYTTWIVGKALIQKHNSAKVAFLVCDTSFRYELATCEVSWIYSIWFRSYEPTRRKHYYIWILGNGIFFLSKTSQDLLHLGFWNGINIGYAFLYCVRENQISRGCHCLYLSICSFSPIKFFITDFSAPITARVFKFCIHLQRAEIIWKKTIMLKFILPSFFSISHSNVMHWDICVKNFSGTTALLKFSTNSGYNWLNYVRENQHPHAYHSLYFLKERRLHWYGHVEISKHCCIV